jgi:hypothetical protein
MERVRVASGQATAEGFDGAADVVNKQATGCDQGLAGVDDLQVRMSLRTSVDHRAEQLGIKTSQPSERLGVGAVGLLNRSRDEAHLPGIRHDHFMAQAREELARPRGVSPDLHHESASL